jgi:hypothetical protein
MSAPPGKKTGALLHAPKTADARQYTRLHDAQGCTHANTRIERMPQGHIHHAREVCADCERHLRWHPKPSILQRQKINELKLKRLAALKLDAWEKNFVLEMLRLQRWSLGQQAWIDRLYSDHIEGTP